MESRPTPIQLETKKILPIGSAEESPSAPSPALSSPASQPVPTEEIERKVYDALKTCYDPEIPVNIFELGLIYGVEVNSEGHVHIRMTLTSPACPAAGSLPPEVEEKAKTVPGVTSCKVDVVWDPPWNQSMMSEVAAVELGLY